MKRLAVIQSSYVPWKGYFDIIGSVDEFILHEDRQYTKQDWRNRNRIKTPRGWTWLTIPVRKGGSDRLIQDVEISDPCWAVKHWRVLEANYSQARYFDELGRRVHRLYQLAGEEKMLSHVNELFIRELCKVLGISTRIRRSTEFELPSDRTDRLIALCERVEASVYLSGPAAKAYLDERRFTERGIAVEWMDYRGYRQHRQLFSPPFLHEVSVLDLLFNEGTAGARAHLLSGGLPAIP